MIPKVPFIFGAQYYRAPTPEPECWQQDIRRMAELGFNAVKYWVQWRWSHRTPLEGGDAVSPPSRDSFYFEDLGRLMDLAAEAGLGVTLNTIFDVAPTWLYDRFPDAKQVMNNGRVVEPYTVGHRQIGGHPGPCYHHLGALRARQDFLAAAVVHFRDHPALSMWDVWNEPELSFPQRTPDIDRLVCYCPHCEAAFILWLKGKYEKLDKLNAVWGRWYDTWEEVELPRNPHTFTDFVDWREFHIDTMTAEAAWRLAMLRELDPDHLRYLHVVPNTMAPFNVVTCAADDFALAEPCQVFAATTNSGPVMTMQVVSAARGRVTYNVESHVNHGCTSLHQRVLHLPDLLDDFLPQIGLGIRGFLFWQYRSEVLGFEAPGWGLVGLDGSDRPITRAAAHFWQAVGSHAEALLDCPPPVAAVGIWRSRKNEIFHYAMHQGFKPLIDSVEAYQLALYWQSVPTRTISGEMLALGELDGLKLLIMPSPYYLTEEEAAQLDAWVRRGGIALVEAHLGGYNATTGRHSRVMPGCGLAEAWGLREVETTAARYLDVDLESGQGGGVDDAAFTEDVKKALAAAGAGGSDTFPIPLHLRGEAPPVRLWGADRYAEIEGEGLEVWGAFRGRSVVGAKPVGAGAVIYAGTRLGQGARVEAAGLVMLLRAALSRAGVTPTLNVAAPDRAHVHVDLLRDREGAPRFLVVLNRDAEPHPLRLEGPATARALFSETSWVLQTGSEITVPGSFADLFVLTPQDPEDFLKSSGSLCLHNRRHPL
jgi:beta-galactosidase